MPPDVPPENQSPILMAADNLSPRSAKTIWFIIFFTGMLAGIFSWVFWKPLRATQTMAELFILTAPLWFILGRQVNGWLAPAFTGPRAKGNNFFTYGGLFGIALGCILAANAELDTSPEEAHVLSVTGKGFTSSKNGSRHYYATVPTMTPGLIERLSGTGTLDLDPNEHVGISYQEYTTLIPQVTRAEVVTREGYLGIPWMAHARLLPDAPRQPMTRAENDYATALAYLNGRGVPKDAATALSYFQKAADAGNVNALRDMGYVYLTQASPLKDERRGRELITRAAQMGSPVAQNDLGLWYGDGTGVKQDWVESYKWMKLSANQGFTQSVQDVEYCKQHMTPAQIAEAEARVTTWRPTQW